MKQISKKFVILTKKKVRNTMKIFNFVTFLLLFSACNIKVNDEKIIKTVEDKFPNDEFIKKSLEKLNLDEKKNEKGISKTIHN